MYGIVGENINVMQLLCHLQLHDGVFNRMNKVTITMFSTCDGLVEPFVTYCGYLNVKSMYIDTHILMHKYIHIHVHAHQ